MRSEPRTSDSVVTASDVARMLDVDIGFVEECVDGIDFSALRYRRLKGAERFEVIGIAKEKLKEAGLPKSGDDDPSRWEAGWGEVLEKVRLHGFAPEQLRPQYFQYDVLRFDGDYIRVSDRKFEYELYSAIRRILFRKYLGSVTGVVEFGCGTGLSLVTLSEMYPGIRLVGCDWARPSQELLALAASELNQGIQGVHFNMLTLEGREDVVIDGQTAVITMHALEQLGTGHGPMLSFLLEERPALCFHLEPLFELYDPTSEFDRVAMDYHLKRNYLNGFLTAVRGLADEGGAEILEERRLGFGSAFHEGYSLLVWRPLP